METCRTSWTRRPSPRCWSRSRPSSSSRARIRSASAPSAPPRGPSAAFRPTSATGLDDGTLAATKGVGPATLQIVGRAGHHRPGEHAGGAARADPARAWSRCSPSPGLGVAKIRQIHDVLGIDSLPELEAAATRRPPGQAAPVRPEDVGEHPQGHRLPAAGERLPAVAPRGRRGRRTAGRAGAAPRRAPAAVVAGDVRRRAEVVRDLVLVLVADVAARRAVQAAEPAPGRARVRRAGRAPAHAPLRRRRERADRGDDAGERGRRAGAGHRQRGAPARSWPRTRRPAGSR